MGKKITEVRNKSKEGGESFKKGAEQGRKEQTGKRVQSRKKSGLVEREGARMPGKTIL